MVAAFWMIVFLQAVVCGVAGSFIAEKFRNNTVPGLILGFLFGPLGILMIVGIPDLRPKCAECGGALEPGYQKCRHCGANVEIAEITPIVRVPKAPVQLSQERKEGRSKIRYYIAKGVGSKEELLYWLRKEGLVEGLHYTDHDLTMLMDGDEKGEQVPILPMLFVILLILLFFGMLAYSG